MVQGRVRVVEASRQTRQDAIRRLWERLHDLGIWIGDEHRGNAMYGSTDSDPAPRAYLVDAQGAAESLALTNIYDVGLTSRKK